MSSANGHRKLSPGLYIVATPIGTVRDITLRALDILETADIVAAEDTRRTRQLLALHGIRLRGRKLICYNDLSGERIRRELIAAVAKGRCVALVSDAGTPLLADPGFRLVMAFYDAGLPVTHAPGPSAVIAALALSGQPTDQFMFVGFVPVKAGARSKLLTRLKTIRSTVVMFESPRRLQSTLSEMVKVLGECRKLSICREITKIHEETVRGTLAEVNSIIAERIAEDPNSVRGEIAIVLGPSTRRYRTSDEEIDSLLIAARRKLSLRDAADLASDYLGVARRTAYRRALTLRKNAN